MGGVEVKRFRDPLEVDGSEVGESDAGRPRKVNGLLREEHLAGTSVIGDPSCDVHRAPEVVARLAASYKTLSSRECAKIVKSPDDYLEKGYHIYACITQFDAATGDDSFRGQAWYKKTDYWYADGDNAFFNGTADQLSDYVTNDVVAMNVTSLGCYSYDTQGGGNTTVPLFQVDSIAHKGSCK